MDKNNPSNLFCIFDEMGCSYGLIDDFLLHIIIELQVDIFHSFILETILELYGSIHNMGHLISLDQFFLAHTAHLITK